MIDVYFQDLGCQHICEGIAEQQKQQQANVFSDDECHFHNSSSLLSGSGNASGSIESDASSTTSAPDVGMANQSQSFKGPKAKRHTTVDNKDILYCFLWAKRMAQQTYSGYAKIMFEKWNVLRPDKLLSITALARESACMIVQARIWGQMGGCTQVI